MVNGKHVALKVPPDRRLVDIIREDLRLTGTKVGCGEGECGACTVIMDGLTINSCLVPACQLDGKSIITIEGLSGSGKMDFIKEAFIQEGAVQCGYCIPGMVISSYQIIEDNRNKSSVLTEEEIRQGLSGNLCRCTGYVKIIKAVKKAEAKMRGVALPDENKKSI